MALITSACPVCGRLKATCGGHAVITPVDDPFHQPLETAMAQEAPKLRTYTYTQYGNEITAQLTEDHAKKVGATPVEEPAEDDAAAKPATKARKTAPDNK